MMDHSTYLQTILSQTTRGLNERQSIMSKECTSSSNKQVTVRVSTDFDKENLTRRTLAPVNKGTLFAKIQLSKSPIREKMAGNKKKSRNQQIGAAKTTTAGKEDEHPNRKKAKLTAGMGTTGSLAGLLTATTSGKASLKAS